MDEILMRHFSSSTFLAIFPPSHIFSFFFERQSRSWKRNKNNDSVTYGMSLCDGIFFFIFSYFRTPFPNALSYRFVRCFSSCFSFFFLFFCFSQITSFRSINFHFYERCTPMRKDGRTFVREKR